MSAWGRRFTAAQVADHERKRSGVKAGDVTSIRLVFPALPPTVNHSGADSFRGGRKTEEYKIFHELVSQRVLDAGSPRIEGRLAIVIDVVPADRRRFDLDGRLKALLDAMQDAGVYADDEQVDDLRIRRMPVFIAGQAGTTVNITRIAVAV